MTALYMDEYDIKHPLQDIDGGNMSLILYLIG